jgi:thiamine-monophosphate kinase
MMSNEQDNTQRTEIEAFGEFGLIDLLTKNIKLKNKSTVFGVGDDTAVLEKDKDNYTLVTKDLLIENVHFDLTYMPLRHLGYKAAVVNFSDIYAMNGTPKQLVIGLSVSNRFSVEAIEEIYAGIYLACDAYGVDVVGGDTTSSPGSLFLSVTAIGEVAKNEVVYRKGAKSGDLICVSGDLGAAYMGLLILGREKKAFEVDPNMQPDLTGHDYILERQLKPEAQKEIIEKLRENKILPTSMIDISDGLASEVIHLCEDSDTGAHIYEEKLPIDLATLNAADEFSIVPSVAALNGGEDYELLFTVKLEDFDKVKEIKGVTVIGHMTDKTNGRYFVANDNTLVELKAQGWDALKNQEEE